MKSYAIYESASKPEAVELAIKAVKILKDLGANVCASGPFVEKLNDQNLVSVCDIDNFDSVSDAIITFGGDGTILSAAHKFINSDVPIMGFNVGKLGFLAEFSPNDLKSSLQDLMEGNYRVVTRTAIETVVENRKIVALNDIVVEKKNTSHMIEIKAYSNGHFIGDYVADGLIVATPTGSTAYSLSAGGPILFPSSPVLCITPISPHSLTLRPLVIPEDHKLELKVMSKTGEVNLVSDGQVKKTILNGDTVTIKKSDASIKLIKPENSSFYDVLRDKFLWAEHRTNKEIS